MSCLLTVDSQLLSRKAEPAFAVQCLASYLGYEVERDIGQPLNFYAGNR
jgi:hypothetical protein